MMDIILSLLTGGQNVLLMIGAAIIGLIGAFAGGRLSGAKREREKQRAKEADAYEQYIEDVAAAADAGNRVRPSGVSDDPYNRDPRPQG